MIDRTISQSSISTTTTTTILEILGISADLGMKLIAACFASIYQQTLRTFRQWH